MTQQWLDYNPIAKKNRVLFSLIKPGRRLIALSAGEPNDLIHYCLKPSVLTAYHYLCTP
ncbi:MAG: hypothetical protein HC890_10685 [Chloroflexaceae bacterium]|nr:hypothetical protein [Chloroflexaceae bacterium]